MSQTVTARETARQLLDQGVPEEAASPLTDGLKAVLDQRLDAFLANPDDTLTWPELKARLQQSV